MSNIKIRFQEINQNSSTLYFFKYPAKEILSFVEIQENERNSEKEEGYQRVLSQSRVNSIANYIDEGNIIPLSILIALDEETKIDDKGKILEIPDKKNAGWVIDGQHRLAGAYYAKNRIELGVVALVGASFDEQVNQFVTINKEAKGVPTSLYYDLRAHLPSKKSPKERSKERAADIAHRLKTDENSLFFAKIVISTPKKGQISLNNFVRKVSSLIMENKGFLSHYYLYEQEKIIENYFKGFKHIFPNQFSTSKQRFFNTLGFGALINALPTIFSLTLKHYQAFKVNDVAKILKNIDYFDFDKWDNYGTGNAAEIQAGEDLKFELENILDKQSDNKGSTLEL